MQQDSSSTFVIAGVSAGAGLVLLGLIICLVIFIVRRHKNVKEKPTEPQYEEVPYQSRNPLYGFNLSPLKPDNSSPKTNLDCENVSGLCKNEHGNEKRSENEISADIPNDTKGGLHEINVLDT